MKPLVLADENIPGVQAALGQGFRVAHFHGRRLTPDQLVGADALLVRSVTPVNAALLDGSALQFVGTATSGLDHIDRDYLRARNIAFAHAPGANANSVVEYVLSAIAHCGERLESLFAGGRVGVVGYGHIGKALAARLQALGIDYVVHDPWMPAQSVPHAVDFSSVLACDVISLHCELTDRQPWPSRHLIGRAELLSIDHRSLLINASRGAVVDNAALLEHLVLAAGPQVVLDVWEGEPAIDIALLEHVRLGTAHIAGYSYDGKLLATRMLCAALCAQLSATQLASASRVHGPSQVALPVSADSSVCLPEGLGGSELVRFLLQARYLISEDDALLRAGVGNRGPGGIGAHFDALRRDYPQRRELAGCVVSGGDLGPADVALVHALGCEYRELRA